MKTLVCVPPRLPGLGRGAQLAAACGHAGFKTAVTEKATDKTCVLTKGSS